MNEIEKLLDEIERLKINRFSYFCNDQYDVCDEIDKQISEINKEINSLENSLT